MVFVGDQASLVVDGELCVSDNKASASAALQGTASFAYVAAGGSVAIGAAADVQIDGSGPDVFLEPAQQAQPSSEAGKFFCNSSSASNSWQPGAYSITGDVCACSSDFEEPDPVSVRLCDSCRGAGWNAALCSCQVRGPLRVSPCIHNLRAVGSLLVVSRVSFTQYL